MYNFVQILFQTKNRQEMKIKILALVCLTGFFIAGCTDKKAAEELATLKTQMLQADSICMADKMMKDSIIMSLNAKLDSILHPVKNYTGSKSTTKTTPVEPKKGDIMTTKGKSGTTDMKTKGKSDEPVDMKTKGKSSNSGGGL